jgi:hypothetical protein
MLGEKHILQRPTAREVYGSGPFDPEGIVGKMSAVEELCGPVDTDRRPMDIGVGGAECVRLSVYRRIPLQSISAYGNQPKSLIVNEIYHN